MKKYTNWKAVSIAIALPSTLLGVIYMVNLLVENKVITDTIGYLFMGVVIIYMFYLMIRFASEKNN